MEKTLPLENSPFFIEIFKSTGIITVAFFLGKFGTEEFLIPLDVDNDIFLLVCVSIGVTIASISLLYQYIIRKKTYILAINEGVLIYSQNTTYGLQEITRIPLDEMMLRIGDGDSNLKLDAKIISSKDENFEMEIKNLGGWNFEKVKKFLGIDIVMGEEDSGDEVIWAIKNKTSDSEDNNDSEEKVDLFGEPIKSKNIDSDNLIKKSSEIQPTLISTVNLANIIFMGVFTLFWTLFLAVAIVAILGDSMGYWDNKYEVIEGEIEGHNMIQNSYGNEEGGEEYCLETLFNYEYKNINYTSSELEFCSDNTQELDEYLNQTERVFQAGDPVLIEVYIGNPTEAYIFYDSSGEGPVLVIILFLIPFLLVDIVLIINLLKMIKTYFFGDELNVHTTP